MSTNKSQNLNLHLWEPDDDFLRTEFNENFTALDTAVKEDRSAIAAAQSTAEQLPYVVGTYSGAGDSVKNINLGFYPSLVLIFTNQKYINETSAAGKFSAFGRNVNSQNKVTLTSEGFQIGPYDSKYIYPSVNNSGAQYQYVAFR